MKARAALLLMLGAACTRSDAKSTDSDPRVGGQVSGGAAPIQAAPVSISVDTLGADTATHAPLPPQSAADSLLTRYLALVAERDGFTAEQFAAIYSDAMPCVEEEYGDAIHSYWLARGRVLGYETDADTLRANLELLTVAAQEPSATAVYGSVVTARLRTDTVQLKLVPDDSRTGWQTCGLLSDGHTLGGYGLPENVEYSPTSVTRAHLLAQVDSIRQAENGRPD